MLSSVYMDILQDIPRDTITGLSREYGRQKLIIGTDTNAHSFLWGSQDENPRGEVLQDIIMDNNLSVLGQGQEPTFVSPIGTSRIDVTLASHKAEELVEYWCVDLTDSGSDHRYIV